jgi:hypothetical protein
MKKAIETGLTGNESESTTMVETQDLTVNTVNVTSTDHVSDYEKEFIEDSIEEQELLPELFGHFSGSIDEPHMNHFLCPKVFSVNPIGVSFNNTRVNKWYLDNKKMYEKFLSEKDYGGVLVVITKPFRTSWFIKNHKKIFKDVGEKKYYELLCGVLTDVELHYYTKKSYSRIINIGDPLNMMSKSERKMYDKLPETFMIYRGVSSDTKFTQNNINKYVGNSWTLDQEKSRWFSNRWYREYKVVFSMEISKSQVLSYFNGRNEKEIFVDYTKLDYSKINIEEIN